MDSKIKTSFLILVLVQGMHSIEEYLGRLWENFPPARFLTGLVSQDHETGFLIINIGLFVFGIWCWMFPVLRDYSFAKGLVVFWVVIEIINGIGHPLWSLSQGGYTPGLATAPILLMLSVYMSVNLSLKSKRG